MGANTDKWMDDYRCIKTEPTEVQIEFEEQRIVALAMMRYGGLFLNKLGKALIRADPNNATKIKATWPKEWEEFRENGQIAKEQGLL